ncbi:MAG: diacylglycerol kinase [Deltaproteobacteria bacterium]|nr:diacylglycerol kinase [Deltaproteobacteria bacterium]
MDSESWKNDFRAGAGRLWRATGYSLAGLEAAFRNEQAFRLEVYIFCLVLPLGLWLGEGGVEKVLLVGSWVLVMVCELVNSAVEAVVDRIGPEPHELSGRAKDIASATVMLTLGLAALTWWLLVF